MIDPASVPVAEVEWTRARRVIRSVHPPIDLFEDIADPADWPLLLSAEQKTNPRLVENVGPLDLVPADRRVGGPGASYLMAPFTHTSTDRPSRFSDGSFGVLYVAREFDTALAETIYHHERFMAATHERPGWTSHFREIVLDVKLSGHDLRHDESYAELLLSDDYQASQCFGAATRANGTDGIVYPSLRIIGGECVAAFYPDVASGPLQGRHLDYHWNGEAVDYFRDLTTGEVFRILGLAESAA